MFLKSIFARIIGISTVLASLVVSFVLFASQPVYAAPACLSSDMMITKVAPATATVGGTITYQLTATNIGPNAATNVIINDPLPPGTTFASLGAPLISGTLPTGLGGSAPLPGGTGTVEYNANIWPVGSSVTINFVVNANQIGAITNTATVSALCLDPDLTNNSATAVTQVQAVTVPTMNEWGMILFLVLAGFGSIYYLRRQKRANS